MSLLDATSQASSAGPNTSHEPPADEHRTRGLAVYVGVAAFLFLAMVGHTLNESWASPDFWVYLGAVREFADHPLNPANPVVIGNDADPYLSPYTWVLGVTSAATGLDAIRVLALAGLANLVLLLAGLYRLVTTLTSRWLAPPLALVFTLFAWGLSPWRWSGFLNANSIGTALPLGSTFAAGFACFALSATLRWLRSGSRAELALVGATIPMVIVCHPFTATWAAAVGLGFVVAAADHRNRRRVAALGVVAATGVALTLAWPFYPVAELIDTSSDLEAINAAVFRHIVPRTFLALPGLVAIGLRLGERRRDPITLGFAAATTLFAIGWVLDRPTLGRALPAVMLMLHVALADLVAQLVGQRDIRLRRATILVVSLGVMVGVVGTAAGMARAVPRALLPDHLGDRAELRSLVDRYRPIGEQIARDDVLVASKSLAPASTIGGKAIAPYVPAPFVHDLAEREQAADIILDPNATVAQRRREVDAYGVDWLVLTPRDADRLREGGAFLAGSLVTQEDAPGLVIVRVADVRTAVGDADQPPHDDVRARTR
jgi:hypothetical protein